MANKLLIAIGAVGAMLALIVAVNFLLSTAPAPLAAVKTFYVAVERGDYETAYALFHADLRQAQSVEDLRSAVQDHPSYFNADYRQWSTDAEESSATVEGQLSTGGAAEVSVLFHLVKQGGDWQIVAYRMRSESGDVKAGAVP